VLQGLLLSAGDKRQYLLTDPALCSVAQQYGASDFGEPAMKAFLSSHTCGPLCMAFAEATTAAEAASKAASKLRMQFTLSCSGHACGGSAATSCPLRRPPLPQPRPASRSLVEVAEVASPLHRQSALCQG
jgi:hypothetical protein